MAKIAAGEAAMALETSMRSLGCPSVISAPLLVRGLRRDHHGWPQGSCRRMPASLPFLLALRQGGSREDDPAQLRQRCARTHLTALVLTLTDEQAVDVGHDLGEDLVDRLLAIDFRDQAPLGVEPE